MIKPLFILAGLFIVAYTVNGQHVDSIYFHLYTDSLKKGTYNYINVDGKLRNGRWLPLTGKEIGFSSSAGTFHGNSLFIDSSFTEEKVTIKAVLKSDTTVSKEIVIYIKKLPDNEPLKTNEEVMPSGRKRKRE